MFAIANDGGRYPLASGSCGSDRSSGWLVGNFAAR